MYISNYLHIYYVDYEDSCFLYARVAVVVVVCLSRSLAAACLLLRSLTFTTLIHHEQQYIHTYIHPYIEICVGGGGRRLCSA